jgi:alpha-D-xyloside xylohydrolase
VESELFEVGEREGYFVKRPDGEVYIIDYGLSLAPRPDGVVRFATPETSWNARVAIVDFTNPAAYRWYQDLHRPVLRMGADVFKTDFGEDIPHDAVFYNGQTGATMHNLYPLLYNQCVFEVTRQERGYGVVWSRSGTAGNQRYPLCWSGDPAADFESLACTIRGGLSVGLSGVPFWSNDIGAFRGMPSPQLYVRWAQFTLLCSHARMHGDTPREPWVFGPEALAIVRRYTLLRYRLFPYLYSLAHEAHCTGLPVIRAMPLVFPDDPNTYDKDLQFMLGPWLLVAPIYDAGEERTVYLPEGVWFDYWTGERHCGPATLRVHAPLDTLPLFVRGGAILPMMQEARRIPAGRIDPLILEIYPQGRSVYTVYEDEGETVVQCQERENTVELTLQQAQPRQIEFHMHGVGAVSGVSVQPAQPGARSEWNTLETGVTRIALRGATQATVSLQR